MKVLLEYSLEKGKRFRPILCLLVSDIFGGDEDEATKNAVIVEFIHTSSLVHDDVIDEDTVRRGMPSLWKRLEKKGVKKNAKNLAILLGDGMLSKATSLNEKNDVIQACADALRDLASGSLKEAYSEKKNEEEYMEVIRLKTGSLFALATQLGSMSARADERMVSSSKKAGLELGNIYQLADDLADGESWISKEETKKLLLEHCEKFAAETSKMPENTHKKVFESVPVYIVNKMIGKKQGFTLQQKNGFKWIENA